MKPGGRAAIVVPDNVLFEDGVGRRLRGWVMDLCNLHTILRLPTGIFYAIGVKTNVAFLTRGRTDRANTKGVWVYDLRANMDSFGKTRPLTVADFNTFEKVFGDSPLGKSPRKDEGKRGGSASSVANRSRRATTTSTSHGCGIQAETLRTR